LLNSYTSLLFYDLSLSLSVSVFRVISNASYIPMQHYKSLRVAIMIWATVVNTQTDRQLLAGYML